jgi:hypothetical protein
VVAVDTDTTQLYDVAPGVQVIRPDGHSCWPSTPRLTNWPATEA